ncbi:MAG: biotin/lipoyl-binding protein [Firmicutes bacterium]|nr:biotin/lipoyl-binding protein [Bacillota bacterium]
MKKYNVTVNGEFFSVEVEEVGDFAVSAPVFAPTSIPAPVAAPKVSVPAPAPAPAPASTPVPAPAPAPTTPVATGGNTVASPLPGTVLRVNVAVGQAVKAGDVLLVLEAMKMENDITAPGAGVVSAIHVNSGSTVQTGDALISL